MDTARPEGVHEVNAAGTGTYVTGRVLYGIPPFAQMEVDAIVNGLALWDGIWQRVRRQASTDNGDYRRSNFKVGDTISDERDGTTGVSSDIEVKRAGTERHRVAGARVDTRRPGSGEYEAGLHTNQRIMAVG